MIHKLSLKNFKGIEAAELRLEPLTVIVGPNASGKTSVLQALALLSQLVSPEAQRERVIQQYGGMPAIKRSKEAHVSIQVEGVWQGKPGAQHMEVTTTEHPFEAGSFNLMGIKGSWGGTSFEIPAASYSPRGQLRKSHRDKLPSVVEEWEASTLLRLEARRLAEPSYAESVEPTIGSDGSGLPSALAQMALNRPEEFAELLSALRAVIPQIVRVRLSLAEVERQEMETITINEQPISRPVVRRYSGHRILLDTKSGTGIPSEAASEGTLLVLGLLTVLMNSPRPKLVLLDDLDRGLHPKAQRDLVAQLRKLLERDPELQIIATSHSPYLVDHLEPREVRLSTVLPEGTIRFAALTDHPDFERWKEAMRPGEFWSTVGERWVGERGAEQP